MQPERWYRKFSFWLRLLLHRPELDQELDDEIAYHIEAKTEENIAKGMNLGEARRAARVELGGVEPVKENMRSVRTGAWFETLLQDVRFGLRMLRRNPGFTAVAVLTLAFGIGANTATFSIVDAVLVRPLPYAHSNQLVDLYLKTKQSDQNLVPYPTFLYWQSEARGLSAIAASTEDVFGLTGMGMATRLNGRRVSANFLSLFGVRPILGRDFSSEDDRIGAAPVALVSEGFWKDRLGGSTTAIGKALTLDGSHYTVIGVVSSAFQFWSPAEIYVPVGQSENPSSDNRGPSRVLQIIGRLAPGVTLAQARAEMSVIDRNRVVAYPESADTATGVTVDTLSQDVIGNLQPTLLLLLGAVGFVLLIACANVASLLLARSTARTHEFAIRAALGAGRSRVMRQVLTESILLFIIGGSLGILLAELVTHFCLALLPTALPQMLRVSLDARVLMFAIGISLLTGILFGLIPAMRTSPPNLQQNLKRTRGIAVGRHAAQSILVVAEISLALVLLTGAGLMVRTMQHLWNVSPGFDPHNLLFFTVGFPQPSKPDATAIRMRDQEVANKLAALPGVESLSVFVGALPLSGGRTTIRYWLNQAPPAKEAEKDIAVAYAVGPEYFRAMRIGLRQGRTFNIQDVHSAPATIIVDEHLARHLFANENPIGQRLNMGVFGVAEIVGVVEHVKQFGLDADSQAQIQAQIYRPFSQLPDLLAPALASQATYILRSSVSPVALVDAIRRVVNETDSQRIVYNVQTMDEVLADSQSERRFSMALLGAFAAIALLLATVGIYGVISYITAGRTNEIGIRVAFGAQRWDILRVVVAQGATIAIVGITVGIIASLELTQLISNQLFGVHPDDPTTLACVVVLLTLVALAASYVPARRAMRIDPMVALRYE